MKNKAEEIIVQALVVQGYDEISALNLLSQAIDHHVQMMLDIQDITIPENSNYHKNIKK